MNGRQLGWAAAFVICVAAGYWLARSAALPARESNRTSAGREMERRMPNELPERKFQRGKRPSLAKHFADDDALATGALANQRTLRFPDGAALTAFLARAGDGVKVLGRLDPLHALRVGFSDYGELADALTGDEEEGFVFPVYDPVLPDGSVQAGAMGLGDGLLSWLGVSGDRSAWGAGVKVAVLDSGVTTHPSLRGNIGQIELVPMPADLSQLNGHGTSVASVIAGNSDLTPGVAPGVDLLSVRIADDNGMSDSFLLARGIVAAVDQGAHLINISMGSQGDSRLVRNAIEYATAAGALIVAAAGNQGTNQVSYPAANEGVVAVGAVDATGDHLQFSNTGKEIALAAPGYLVNAAGADGGAVRASGTSFSAPIVTGVLAAVMTEAGGKTLTPGQAYELVNGYLNDAGAQGFDQTTGAGLPDLSRIFNRNTAGIYDAAVAGATLADPSPRYPNGSVDVLVQNRGTEPLLNTSVQIDMGGGVTTLTVTSLAKNESKILRVPVTRAPAPGTQLRVEAKVSLPQGRADAKPGNDASVRNYVAGGG